LIGELLVHRRNTSRSELLAATAARRGLGERREQLWGRTLLSARVLVEMREYSYTALHYSASAPYPASPRLRSFKRENSLLSASTRLRFGRHRRVQVAYQKAVWLLRALRQLRNRLQALVKRISTPAVPLRLSRLFPPSLQSATSTATTTYLAQMLPALDPTRQA
jgi:hypothetical protein